MPDDEESIYTRGEIEAMGSIGLHCMSYGAHKRLHCRVAARRGTARGSTDTPAPIPPRVNAPLLRCCLPAPNSMQLPLPPYKPSLSFPHALPYTSCTSIILHHLFPKKDPI